MESYRHALYRYSTGQGFNVNVDVPEKVEEVTSYKFKPLLTRQNMNPNYTVDVLREADRISMQVEATQQVMKNIGYDEQIGKDFKKLKNRLEVIQRLIVKRPLRYILVGDLDNLYTLYENKTPDFDQILTKVVEKNKYANGIHPDVGTAFRIKKGYPLFDRYGRRLVLPKEELFLKDKIAAEEKSLSGLEDVTAGKFIGPALVALLMYLYFKK